MNRKAFEQFFQKPEGFFWSEDLQMYYEHKDYHFKYPLEAIGNFNQKWMGWLAAQQIIENSQRYSFKIFYDEWKGSYIGEVESAAGEYIKYGPIEK